MLRHAHGAAPSCWRRAARRAAPRPRANTHRWYFPLYIKGPVCAACGGGMASAARGFAWRRARMRGRRAAPRAVLGARRRSGAHPPPSDARQPAPQRPRAVPQPPHAIPTIGVVHLRALGGRSRQVRPGGKSRRAPNTPQQPTQPALGATWKMGRCPPSEASISALRAPASGVCPPPESALKGLARHRTDRKNMNGVA